MAYEFSDILEELNKGNKEPEVILYKVLSDIQGIFTAGTFVYILEECPHDGVHYYSNGLKEGYLSPTEVLKQDYKLTRK